MLLRGLTWLVLSLVVSLVFTGWLMQTLIRRQQRRAGRA